MIFVTVGCSNFKFDRLFRMLDDLCDKRILQGKDIVAQTGKLSYRIRNYQHFDYDSNEKMQRYQKNADFVICHAGTGTVVGALKKGKKIIIVPRLQRYNEHESDHQMDLARDFEEEGYVLCAMDEKELEEALEKVGDFCPKPFVSNRENFYKMICGLL